MSSNSKKQKTNSAQQKSKTGFASVESYFEKYGRTIFFWMLCAGVALAGAMFNTRILENDDALYIEGGYNYATNFFGYYYTVNAPLYVMFLALPIAIVGVNLVVLKLFSVIFYAAGFFFLYKAFTKRVPNVVLYPTLLLVGLNSYVLTYASLTFTEAFYMMLQSLFFIFFFRHIEHPETATQNLRTTWKAWLGIGFALFALSMTRNVAAAAVGAVVLYFVSQKQFRNSVYTLVSFALFFSLYSIIKNLIWGNIAGSQFSMQGGVMFHKNPYDASQGMETFGGFVERFVTNTEIYFSSRFFEILGLRQENSEPSVVITILFAAAVIAGLYFIIKNKQKVLLVSALYFLSLCGATFISLHTSWGQPRFVMIHLPFILLTILYGVYQLSENASTAFFKPLFVLTLLIVGSVGVYSSVDKANTNFPILQKNIDGDLYYGYPDQWANYAKISRWAADNLGNEAYIACRKPPVSFVYGKGKTFQGIYNVPSTDPDTLIHYLKNNGVTHIVLDAIAGTVYRYMSIVESKYKGTFELVHEEGKGQTAAYLFKINYR